MLPYLPRLSALLTLKHVTYGLLIAAASLFAFAVPSALGARGSHPSKTHATPRAVHRQRAGQRYRVRRRLRTPSRRDHHRRLAVKRGAVVHYGGHHRAAVVSTTMLLGDNAVEWQSDLLPAGQAEAFRLRAQESGLASIVHLYISAGNAAGTVNVGLYGDADGQPGSLLATGSGPASSAGRWSAVPITPIELSSGRPYWLAILGQGGTLRYRDRRRGPCPSQTSAQTSLGALPSPWMTGTTYSDCPISAYMTSAEPVRLANDPIEPVAPAPPLEPVPLVKPAAPEEPAPTPSGEPASSPPVNAVAPSIAGSAVEGRNSGPPRAVGRGARPPTHISGRIARL